MHLENVAGLKNLQADLLNLAEAYGESMAISDDPRHMASEKAIAKNQANAFKAFIEIHAKNYTD